MNSSTADQILDCAHSLMIRCGYNGFSYADIAQRVGIRKSSIHHHFPNKSDLGAAVVQRYRGQVRAILLTVDESGVDAWEKLNGYVIYWKNCIHEGLTPFCVCAMLAAEISALPEEVAVEVRGHFRELAKWLGRVVDNGAASGRLVLGSDADEEAAALMAAIHGGMLAARALDEPAAFDTVAVQALARLTPGR